MAASPRWVWALVGGAVGIVGVAVGAAPAVALVGLAGALGGAALLLRLDLAPAAVAFLLWANVPVVVARGAGLPQNLAAGYLLLLLLPVARRVLIERRPLGIPMALPWALAFLASTLLSAAFARDPQRAMEGAKEYALEGTLVFLLASLGIRGTSMLRTVAWGLMCAGIFMGGLAAFQQFTGSFDSDFGGFATVDSGFSTGEVSTQGAVSQPRLAGPLGEKNRFGQVMLVLVGIGVGLARAETSRTLQRLAWLATAVSAMGAALTFSRGTAVAFVLLILLMAMAGAVKRRQVAAAALLGLLVLLALPQYRSRLATIASVFALASSAPDAEKPDNAILGRATQVIGAALVYVDHPVVGVGPGLFPSYAQEYGNPLGLRRLRGEREAHMLLPHVAAEGGTLGLLSFGGVVISILLALLRRSRTAATERERQLALAYFLGLGAYLLCGLFLHLSFIRYFWFLAGAAAAACVEDVEPREVALPVAAEGRA